MLINNLKENPIIPFIMTGDDTIEKTLENIEFYIQNGIKTIEIGVPFSDPTADGPIIQAASLRALNNSANIIDSLRIIRQVKDLYPHIKVYLMSYLNPVLKCCNDQLIASKVDGLIIPDMPIEEYSSLNCVLPIIGLIPVGTAKERVERICNVTGEFVYLVSNIGTTGSANIDADMIHQTLATIRGYTDLPVAIGFGINSIDKINHLKNDFDGIVIGSYFIELCHSNNMKLISDVIAKTVI